MFNPQKFFFYAAGIFLLVLSVVIYFNNGVITVNINLNLVPSPSLEGDRVGEKPSYYFFPPPVGDYPRIPEPRADEFLYPPDSDMYDKFDRSPVVPGSPTPKDRGKGPSKQKFPSGDNAVNSPFGAETDPAGSGKIGFL
jgi:hypothetical protein